jgi:hypothetical protein
MPTLRRGPLAQVIEQAIQLVRAQMLVAGVAVHDRGAILTADEVVVFVETEQPVAGGLAGSDAQALVHVLHGVVARARDAADVAAHVQPVAGRRRAAKHRIEGHHAENVRGRQVEQARHVVERLVGKVTNFILNQVKHRDQGGLRIGVAPAHPVDRLLGLG